VRLLLATHPAGSSRSPVGTVREGTVYEQFFTTLPSPAFTPADVLDLYLHRGSFETVLADEDEEQAKDSLGIADAVGTGVLANHQPVDLEPPLRVWATGPGNDDAGDGPRLFAGA
jgi:hypothetical protein